MSKKKKKKWQPGKKKKVYYINKSKIVQSAKKEKKGRVYMICSKRVDYYYNLGLIYVFFISSHQDN